MLHHKQRTGSVSLQRKHGKNPNKTSLFLPCKYSCWWDNICYLQILSIADLGLAKHCGHCVGIAQSSVVTLWDKVQNFPAKIPPGVGAASWETLSWGQGRRENPNWDAIGWALGGSGHL